MTAVEPITEFLKRRLKEAGAARFDAMFRRLLAALPNLLGVVIVTNAGTGGSLHTTAFRRFVEIVFDGKERFEKLKLLGEGGHLGRVRGLGPDELLILGAHRVDEAHGVGRAARLREPSTWAGLAAIAATLGHAGGAQLIGQIGAVLAPLFGGVAVVVADPSRDGGAQ